MHNLHRSGHQFDKFTDLPTSNCTIAVDWFMQSYHALCLRSSDHSSDKFTDPPTSTCTVGLDWFKHAVVPAFSFIDDVLSAFTFCSRWQLLRTITSSITSQCALRIHRLGKGPWDFSTLVCRWLRAMAFSAHIIELSWGAPSESFAWGLTITRVLRITKPPTSSTWHLVRGGGRRRHFQSSTFYT